MNFETTKGRRRQRARPPEDDFGKQTSSAKIINESALHQAALLEARWEAQAAKMAKQELRRQASKLLQNLTMTVKTLERQLLVDDDDDNDDDSNSNSNSNSTRGVTTSSLTPPRPPVCAGLPNVCFAESFAMHFSKCVVLSSRQTTSPPAAVFPFEPLVGGPSLLFLLFFLGAWKWAP